MIGRGPRLAYAGSRGKTFQARARLAALGVAVPAAMFVLAGCGDWALDDGEQQSAEYGAICTRESDGVRLDDDACGDADDEGHSHTPGMMFLWMGQGGGYVPPVGQRVAPGTGPIPKNFAPPGMVRSVPKGAPTAKGLSKSGQSIQRGGLGLSGSKAGGTAGGKSGGTGGSGGS